MKIQHYITTVLEYIELNPDGKRDFKQELTDHFTDKITHYQKSGMTEQEATAQTCADFGEPKSFARNINRAFFPFRHRFLAALGILTVLFALLVSISLLTVQGTLPFVWLTLTAGSGAALFFFTRKPARSANQRLPLLLLLIGLSVLYFYGWMLMDGFYTNRPLHLLSIAFLLSLTVLALSQIVSGAVYQPVQLQLARLNKQKRMTTVLINVLSGLLVAGTALTLLAGGLIFNPSLAALAGPVLVLVLWLFFVIGELKWRRHGNAFRTAKLLLAFCLLSYVLAGQVMYS